MDLILENTEYDEIIKVIASYSSLKKGWDYGMGVSASKDIVNIAESIHLIGKSFGFQTEPHPSVDGGINLIFSLKDEDDFLDILINPDGTIDMRQEKGKGVNFEIIEDVEKVDYDYIILKFYELKNVVCNTSDYSILKDTTPQIWAGLPANHSENLKVEFQCFQFNVQRKKVKQFATI